MTVTINGTTGVAGVDGSASTPALQGTDTNTGITFPAADTVAVATGGTERMRVDSSGNVAVRTTSATSPITVGRVDSSSEGGQIDFCRSSDNANSWGIDVYGSTSTPSLRFVDNVAAVTRASIDGSGNFAFNSGYGSSATAYGCRAWVNFNGTGTVAIRASGNVTSITDNGTGDYTVNFTTALTDANYATLITGTYGFANSFNTTAPTTTAARIQTFVTTTGSNQDQAYIAVAFIR